MSKKAINEKTVSLPLLKTPEQMSKVCGIGVNQLRELMNQGKLAYLPNGNRRLISDAAIWDYYEAHKVRSIANI